MAAQPKLTLHTMLGNYPNVAPLKSGAVHSDLVDFDFVEVDANVQQRGSGQRRAVQGEGVVGAASEFRRIDLFVGKGAAEQIGIAAQMLFEQIDAAAVERHGGRVGERESVLDVQFEDAVLGGGCAAVGFEDDVD